MSVAVMGAYAIGILLIFVLARFLVVPLRMVLRLAYNGLMGGAALWLINLAGGSFGFALPVTVWSALLVGFFGLAGVAALVVYQLFFLGKVV